jgi:serine/threonine-protein kinase
MLQTGDTLAGYRVEGVAGVGGMGVVYRATQMSLDRPVALKVLSSTLVGNRTFRERFRREGRHAAALDHPNIIPVYEAGESNGLMFIAMRLVDGPSLADLIETNSISGSEALRVVGAIASALDAAHEAGLVHRDIKPQNILLTRAGHPYLADFGITKGTDHGDLTHSGDFVGSLNYVAPEQIDGSDVTGASDIYSLTAVLFHCLSGLHPYERESDAALMHAHLTAPAPTLGERGIVAPPALDEVFRVGMAKMPAQRYSTATELVEACRRALALVDADALERYPAFAAEGAPSWSAPSPEPWSAPPAPVAPTPEPEPFAWATAPPAPPVDVPAAVPAYAAPAVPEPAIPAQRDLTAADFRRAFTDQPVQPPPARSVSPEVLGGLALLLLVLAPVSGYALGHTGSPPASKRASSAALTLEHDATWAPTRAGIRGLKLTQAVKLRRGDGLKLAAGRLPTFALGFDPVPPALRRRFAGRTQDATIRLGGATASRHAVALDSGGRLWLALVPDSKGWIAVACEGPGADRDTACPAVASSLTIRGASAVPLGPSKQVATAIGGAIDDLNRSRKSAARPLRSTSLVVRAHALGRVAAAHTRAANILTGLRIRPQEGPLVAGLADALRAQSPKLVALASATTRRRRADYNTARSAIRRQDRRVAAALRRLRSIGYDAS